MRRLIGEKFKGSVDKPGEVVQSRLNGFSHRSLPVDVGIANASGANETASSATERILNIVAHADDDLLFLSPDLLHAIQAGHNVRTVIFTAGDCGNGADYWMGREVGARAAYAQMSGVANVWTQADAGIVGHPIPVFTLSAYPSVSLVFVRLPEGNFDGSGFSSTSHQTLRKLWTGAISTIRVIDGSSSYTKETLTSTLTSLMSSFQPNQINTLDYLGAYGDGDHSDHHSVAYLVQAALQQYTTPHRFTGYEAYSISYLPANVTGTDLTAKQKAFYTYAEEDLEVHNCTSSCYVEWLERQYAVGPRWRQGRWRMRRPARLVIRAISKLYRRYLACIVVILIGGTMLTQAGLS